MVELQLMAGSISSVVFVSSSLPMVVKAVRTRDMRSYSLANITLANVGNLLYWIYVLSLPFGPIWFLHGFNTLVALIMLLLYLHHETDLDRIGGIAQKRQSVSRR